jgi:phage-related minor tail protein
MTQDSVYLRTQAINFLNSAIEEAGSGLSISDSIAVAQVFATLAHADETATLANVVAHVDRENGNLNGIALFLKDVSERVKDVSERMPR